MTSSDAPAAPQPASFRLGYVPGVTPAKWVRIWTERLPDVPLTLVAATAAEAPGLLLAGELDAALLRLPVDKSALSAIPLYTETTVAVCPKDHVVTAAEEVTCADLADDILLHPLDDTLEWEAPPGRPAFERPATTGDAIELVAAGIGLLVVPQSLARLHHRRDLTFRPVADAPGSRIALSWPLSETTPPLVEEFIGIVRGRTVNSSRGLGGQSQAQPSSKPAGKQAGKQTGKQPAGRKPAARTGAGAARQKPAPGRGTKGGKSTGKPRRRG
ncbi:LysR family transcriptional regulator substrate-binding protein [Kitasatospora cinereorecta]|uniref:LysR family transcriptional regulator substrate-binding protein n=1 Tax=Kitasatospora cinereorecta TaxID=285560 RepID=A0ABW0VPI2_9ACTN